MRVSSARSRSQPNESARGLRRRDATVAAMVLDGDSRMQLRRALSQVGSVIFLESGGDLRQAVARWLTRAVIVEVRDFTGASTAPLVRELKLGFPSVPVLVYCDCTCEQTRQLLCLVRAGADAIIFRGRDDTAAALPRLLKDARQRSGMASAADVLGPLVGPGMRPFLMHCLAHGDQPLEVAAVARAVGVDRKTLTNRSTAAGLPKPHVIVAWCRLLAAASILEDPMRSVEHTALALRFGSASAFRNMLRRYVGLNARQLRVCGGSAFLLGEFARALKATGARHRAADQRRRDG